LAAGDSARPVDVDYWDARADHEWRRARLAALNLAEREGTLVKAKDVELEIFNAVRSLRNQLMLIPDRISASVAVEPDPDVIHRLLREEIRGALGELAAHFGLSASEESGANQAGQ
jgi:hypothetical protein